ncbi:MAG: ABC transporter permease [Chloroflexi bacterium]|nr:ABC transporter permease [Chloroflexota bacterium]
MKALDVAFKDLLRHTRSLFVWFMIFGAPLLIAGLIYFAFSGLGSGSGQLQLPATSVQVVNLDQPSSQLGDFAAGQVLLQFLQDPDLAGLLQVTVVTDEASARRSVDNQEADLAVIIPADLSTALASADKTASVCLYHDPTLTIGPAIVKGLIDGFVDGFSGSRIASVVLMEQFQAHGLAADASAVQGVALQYATWAQAVGQSRASGQHPAVIWQAPPRRDTPAAPLADLAGKILAGQLIFFSFYTAAASAQSIITEEEQGTLARAFTTPTSRTTILAGKFLAVLLLVLGQIVVLAMLSSLLFGVRWGQLPAVAAAIVSLVTVATGFGILLMSFAKSTQQAGLMSGIILTVLGMAGGLFSVGVETLPRAFELVSRLTPHGWALQAWKLAFAGAGLGELLLPAAVLTLFGAVFFAAGALVFRRRLA